MHENNSTIKTILRDGTIYFFAIFSLNLMNTLIFNVSETVQKSDEIFTDILFSLPSPTLRV